MRSLSICLGVALFACQYGDNIHPPDDAAGGPDAPLVDGSTTDGGIDATPSVCGDGQVTGAETCDDPGLCCQSCQLVVFGMTCRAATGDCDAVEVCDGLLPGCPADVARPDGTPCPGGFCNGGTCTTCDMSIDADFDGASQCADCDDNNGLVFPGATETCDGVDEDCDGAIDETFDMDGDTYSTCSTDPLLFDCDDTRNTVHPGAPELCGGAGTGNGRDDNCNGYIDETCTPCTTLDVDGDGVTDCMGDCDDTNNMVSPTLPEQCDGFDTDCNTFTIDNCDVSEPCNFASNADVCMDDLQCGCIVNMSGMCTGDYRCASFCEGSFTGPVGAGCTATQACLYRWTLSDNQHACAETTMPLGMLLAGEVCTADAQCRSGACDTYCAGPGCQTRRCVDYCDHEAPGAGGGCAAGTVCELLASSTIIDTYLFAYCRLDNNGARVTGQSCTGGCRWGPESCVNNVCAEPCGEDAHCPTGFHCSLRGNQVQVGTWGAGSPVGVIGEPGIETVPVCLADGGPGLHDRPPGAVCTQNGDCNSELCVAGLGICAALCVTDASCPTGLTCDPIFVRSPPGAGNGIVWSRACVPPSAPVLIESM